MRIKTTKKIVEEVKITDQNSAINENMLSILFETKTLHSFKRGNRTVAEVDHLIVEINQLFGIEEKTTLVRVRSIHNAYVELKDTEIGISEERIRFLVVKERLPHVKVGNRVYIALESFEAPYNESLIYDDYMDSKQASIEKHIEEQFAKSLARREKRR